MPRLLAILLWCGLPSYLGWVRFFGMPDVSFACFSGVSKLFFLGINGIGMSSLAKLFHEMGYFVSGSCDRPNRVSAILESFGISVIYDHKPENISGFDCVVYSSAIKEDNPEVVAARKLGIPVVHRSYALGFLMEKWISVGVMGSHGKTTISGMVSSAAFDGGIRVNAAIGGILPAFGWNGVFSPGATHIVAEVDESDASFDNVRYDIILLNNISPEHLVAYDGSYEAMISKITHFIKHNAKGVPMVALCIDNPAIRNYIVGDIMSFIEDSGGKLLTYGTQGAYFLPDGQPITPYVAFSGLVQSEDGIRFNLLINGEFVCETFVPLYGAHNAVNSLGALCLLNFMDLSFNEGSSLLANFKGVDRRFSIIHKKSDLIVIDDYAHHHIEVSAFLAGLRRFVCDVGFKRLICFFQPHRYTRIDEAMNDYVGAFSHLDFAGNDRLFITPVYSAGEVPIEGVNSVVLANKINEFADANRPASSSGFAATGVAVPISDSDVANLAAFLGGIVRPGDVVAFISAGSLSDIARSMDFSSLL